MGVALADRRPVLIAGPTASGKSALAVEIAARDDGCVINADALQVYGCWEVLSARPSAADLARAPHALYGHVSARTRYSVGAWLRDLEKVLGDLRAQDLRPVIVGGTGLYLTSLLRGLSNVPEIDPAVRARSSAYLADGAAEIMVEDLRARDPETARRTDLRNPMRVQRAWDVLMSTGRGLTDWHRAQAPPLLDAATCDLVSLECEKSLLNKRIAERFEGMVARGALAECRAYLDAGHDPSLPSAKALGADALFAHLCGEMRLDAAIDAAVVATRQFAKRQRTWFRRQMKDWRALPAGAPDLPAAIAPDPGRHAQRRR